MKLDGKGYEFNGELFKMQDEVLRQKMVVVWIPGFPILLRDMRSLQKMEDQNKIKILNQEPWLYPQNKFIFLRADDKYCLSIS